MIDDARSTAGRWQDMREPLLDSLAKLDAPDIIRWKQIFDEYQDLAYKDKLWAAAAAMLGGCSDDGFIDFRAWLTAQGKDVFMAALADPDSLADVGAVQAFAQEVRDSEGFTPLKGYQESASFEKLIYTPSDAYEQKTEGGDIYGPLYSSHLPAEEVAAIAAEINYAEDIDAKWGGIGTDWSVVDQQLQRLVPRLHRAFDDTEPPERQPEKPVAAKTGNDVDSKSKWDRPVDVICGEDLTAFPTRKIARDFFFEGMCATEGSERDRYTAIFIGLEETDAKMVHDGEAWEDNPCIRSVSHFKGDHIGDRKQFDKPTTYNSYVDSKTSVIAKIRAAKASAKNNPPAAQEKPQSIKSHEPEI